MNSGIVGYGVYVPKMRIRVEEIAKVWGKDARKISESLNVREKAIAGFDEDCCTIAVEAARNALEQSGIDTKNIGAIYVGSESHPYAVKPTASIVADAIQAGPDLTAADLEFACKAGTAGIQMCMGLVESGRIEYGMSIGADTAQSKPNDPLEFTASSGGGAIIVGGKRDEIVASIDETYSYTTDTPDFWRRPMAEFPRHGGRFTGEPAYFKHVVSAAKVLMERLGLQGKDFDYAVFHQPNGKFPLRVAKILGIEREKIKQGLVTPMLGNTYSGSTIIGLCSILDKAKAGDRILAVSYGSGAGSDAFALTATKILGKKRAKISVEKMIKEKEYVDYACYIKNRKKLKSL